MNTNLCLICFTMGFLIDKISLFPFGLGIIFGSVCQYKLNFMDISKRFVTNLSSKKQSEKKESYEESHTDNLST